VIASIGIEHLGQMKVEEGGGKPFHKTNVPSLTSVYVTNNKHMVDLAIEAVKDSNVPRAQVQCPGRRGVHAASRGHGGARLHRQSQSHPGAACFGALTGYWFQSRASTGWT